MYVWEVTYRKLIEDVIERCFKMTLLVENPYRQNMGESVHPLSHSVLNFKRVL